MISTSIIFSTGEKKWMPMKLDLILELLGRSELIGRVEVLEAKIAPGFSSGCALA